VLDYIGTDLVAASEAFRHFQAAQIRAALSQHSPASLNRLCLNHIFIALCRWQEFYERFARYIPEHEREAARNLTAELEKRPLRTFRNEFLAHVWSRRFDRPLTEAEIVSVAHEVAGGEFGPFVDWIHHYHAPLGAETVVRLIERIRDSFRKAYKLSDEEIAPGLFAPDA
jgi:hypothetical protein